MLNTNCLRETKKRTKQTQSNQVDFERHDRLLTAQEATYEASRCLGTVSCEACDLCRLLCPDLAITRNNETGSIIIDLIYCKGCGICAAVCPKGAITMVLEESS